MNIEIMSFSDYNIALTKLNEEVMTGKDYIILSDIKDSNENTILLYLNKENILAKYAEATVPENIDIKSGNRLRLKFIFDDLGKNKAYSIFKNYLKDIIANNKNEDNIFLAKSLIEDMDSKIKEMVDFDNYQTSMRGLRRSIGDTVE